MLRGEDTLLGGVITGVFVGKEGFVLDLDSWLVFLWVESKAGRRSSGETRVQHKTCPGPGE